MTRYSTCDTYVKSDSIALKADSRNRYVSCTSLADPGFRSVVLRVFFFELPCLARHRVLQLVWTASRRPRKIELAHHPRSVFRRVRLRWTRASDGACAQDTRAAHPRVC